MSAPPARQPCFLKCSQGTDCIDDYYLPEWFCTGTEDSQPGEGEEAGVDRQAELNRQLRRHHTRQDQGALQE